MTAYNFQKQFAPSVESGKKCQTVRGNRKRHARPGEPVQLYTGMRTRACRKLVDPDPICTSVEPIWMMISDREGGRIEAIEIGGKVLIDSEIKDFCIADGFAGWNLSARNAMGCWFVANHGVGQFEGVVIKWQTAP